jgi:hypothetical protein
MNHRPLFANILLIGCGRYEKERERKEEIKKKEREKRIKVY